MARSRLLLVASLIPLVLSTPALAQRDTDRSAANRNDDRALADAARQIDDPAVQDRMARAMQAMSRALLAMPVGPLAEAAREIDPDSPMADMPRDTRVADLMGDDAEDLPARLGGQSRTMMRAMSVMARQMAALAPVLRDMASDMGAQMEREMRNPR